MSCHTWGYKRIEDFPKHVYEDIKSECDEKAKRVLEDTRTAEEIYQLSLSRGYYISLKYIKIGLERRRKIALKYKNNIDSNPTLIRYYINCKYNDNKVYIADNKNYDEYIRIDNYPNKVFTDAETLIKFCNRNGWVHVYWFNKEEQLIKGNENIKEAKNRIRKMFNENKNVLIDFG